MTSLAVGTARRFWPGAAASSPYPFAALGITTPWTRTGKTPPPRPSGGGFWRGAVAGLRAGGGRPAYEGAGVHSLALGGAGSAGPAPDSGGGGLRRPAWGLRGPVAEAPAGVPAADRSGGLLTAVKSKRYTRSRLDRMVLCAFLGLTAEDLAAEAPYVRILGFRDRGRQALREMSSRLPLPTPARGWKAPILPWNSGAKTVRPLWPDVGSPGAAGSGWPACSLGGRPM